MKFWQAITWAETDQIVEIARFAEEVGFHGLMTGDHALYPQQMHPGYPYSDTGYPPQTAESEYPDQWALFGAVAAATKTIRMSCGVYVLPLRNPIEVAKACATLSILSKGRFILGAGAGWIGAGNTPEQVPALMQELQRLRVEAGRDHLPFETLVGLMAPVELTSFQSLQGTGMSSGLNMPFEYGLGKGSSLDDKKRFMEDFAERIIRRMQ